jgi:AraC-like DNA-binding protein
MNIVQPLGSTPAITLERFGHAPGLAHRDPERECAAGSAINFVSGGSFRIRTDAAWQALTPDRLFVTRPGLEFSCTHDDDFPEDECLTVAFSEGAIESLRSAGAPFALRATASGSPVFALTNRRAYLGRGLAATAAGDGSRLEALAGALYWTLGASATTADGEGQQPLFRASQLSWYAARIDRAKELMRAEFAEPLSLSRMAREAGMSLYPFARIFRELEGETPHRYLVGLRLAEAERRLRRGDSVTDACFAVGFGSLSHFTTTFRRAFGRRPSALRGEPAPIAATLANDGRIFPGAPASSVRT